MLQYVAMALAQNKKVDGIQYAHTCIEPYRDSVVNLDKEFQPKLIKKTMQVPTVGLTKYSHCAHNPSPPLTMQEVPITMFDQLEPGDVLFIDSSHVFAPYGDVFFQLIYVLPTLKPGVLVHIHDIFLPYSYDHVRWKYNERKGVYMEQYVVAAFLHGNPQWRIVWTDVLMYKKHPKLWDDLDLHDPQLAGTFWIEKIQ